MTNLVEISGAFRDYRVRAGVTLSHLELALEIPRARLEKVEARQEPIARADLETAVQFINAATEEDHAIDEFIAA